ncbi:M15 family metallopeptidase [Streptomyces sp. BV286]|uniref:M15 family metallopeptidase n=1 Tax=Streptomyces sp. BV286 TaxID=2849672 RepID=UPI001C2EEAF0|nr:M15 family metallopeptidase [Streptomyces sp. BV286]MBV1936246.1 M15 family metallopeptidase [Streptomyces sp. BV286]
MTQAQPSARTTTRRIHRLLLIGLAVVVATITAAFGHQWHGSSDSSDAPPATPFSAAPPPKSRSAPSPNVHRNEHGSAPVEAGGAVPDGVTVFDDEIAAVAGLDPALLAALREAATDAEKDRVEFYVNSGRRSPEYQEQLLREAVARYGSEAEAARWVATAATSPHVSGDAVDIGESDATAWLSRHGAEYGLCQIYENEPWHYELRPDAVDDGCPRTYADPTQDPRMQQ